MRLSETLSPVGTNPPHSVFLTALPATSSRPPGARAVLDGLVLEGEFTAEFPAALRKAAGSMLVIEIAKDAAPWRWKTAPILAVAGVAPRARNLSELGSRG